MQDLACSVHADGQGLVASVSSKFWSSALERSAVLLHFGDMFMLGLVLSAVADSLCLFLLWSFPFAAWTQVVPVLRPEGWHPLPSSAGVGDSWGTQRALPGPHAATRLFIRKFLFSTGGLVLLSELGETALQRHPRPSPLHSCPWWGVRLP